MMVSTLLATVLFARSAPKTAGNRISLITGAWLLVVAMAAIWEFFADTAAMPPRMLVAVAPALLTTVLLFSLPRGRHFIDTLQQEKLIWVHIVRIPVELVLYWLYQNKSVPADMTFEGSNFDILSGITAPLAWWFCFKQGKLVKPLAFMVWNLACLALLVNIVATGLLSAPSPIQQFNFNQPNTALLFFPYVWLPAMIVPIVLFSHLTALRYVLLNRKKN